MDEKQYDVDDCIEEKQYDVDAIKSRLLQYRERDRDIDNQIERLERLEIKMTTIGSPVITDMPKASGPSRDRIADMLIQKEELEMLIREDVQYQSDERKFFEVVLRNLRHSDERAVIRMRYIDGESWNGVAEMLFGGKIDYLGKEDTYLRRVHKIHGSALLNMAIFIEESTVGDDTANS